MRSVVIIGRKSIERMLGLLCIIAATLIFGMSVKAAGPEEIAYVYLDEDVVGTSGVQNIVVGFHKEEMVIGGARLFYQTESGTEGIVEAAQILNNTVLFQKEGMEEIGTYQITGIAYLDGSGAEQTILFTEKGITASFQVVQDEALFVPESGAQVETYSMNEGKQMVQAGAETAEAAISETLDEAGVTEAAALSARSGERREVVVAIGAGHDANHPGASANGLREEVLTLKVARYCQQELSQYRGVRVVMIRESENCPYNSTSSYCLNQRVKDAKNAGADLYVDLHFNSGGGTGAEIYYPNKNYRPDLSEEGLSVSNKILEQLSALGLTNRGAKIKDSTLAGPSGQYPDGSKADYFTTNVLAKELGLTGIIVEHAFLDHGYDAAKLQNENFLRQLGIEDATGIAQKYGLVKGNETKQGLNLKAHVQELGWQSTVGDGELCGTTGRALGLEALQMSIAGMEGVGIEYSAHVRDIGWQGTVRDGETAGTTGRNLQIEALKIKLTGSNATKYNIYYRGHASNIGWLDWAKDGQAAGTQGYAYQLEAVEVRIVPAGSAAPGATNRPFLDKTQEQPAVTLSYQAHVSEIGWQNAVGSGVTAGTVGRALPIEALKVNLSGISGIQYRAHVSEIGWQSNVTNGKMSGTTGRALPMEALEMKLTGNAAAKYDIYYRTHCRDFGWLAWTKNGGKSGSAGYAKSIEAVEIQLIPKGQAGPSTSGTAFKER